jgi:hypothetical protein
VLHCARIVQVQPHAAQRVVQFPGARCGGVKRGEALRSICITPVLFLLLSSCVL